MSYNKIEECLNKVYQINKWETQLISYNHKTHPNEFTCYTFNFSNSTSLKNTVNYMCKNYKYIVNKFNNLVMDYTGFNPKTTVDKLSITNDVIKESWESLIQHINISDDTTSLKNIKANAFIFIGTYLDNNIPKNIYFIGRRNPILSYKQRSIFTSNLHNTISEIDTPILQFPKSFDAIVYEGIIYMINSNCESIFNMEHSYKLICNHHLSDLYATDLISDFDTFKNYATSGHTPKKFITYDKPIVEKLSNSEWRQHFSTALKIPLNDKKQFDLNDSNNAKRFICAICGKTKNNLFETSLCEVPSSVPITLP